jgi:hypothetical protein
MSAAGRAPAAGTDAGARGGSEGGGARAGTNGDGATTSSGASGGTAGTTNDAGAPSGGIAGMDTNPVTSCNAEFGFLGTWEGSRLDFFFEPMEPVLLEFSEDDEGVIQGTIAFGEPGEPLPPPVDGDTPWPPDYWGEQNGRGGSSSVAALPGFPYTVRRGAGCDNSLRFGISTAEFFDEWCRMMTPVYTSEEYGWGCTLQGGGSVSATECIVTTREGRSGTYPPWKCDACGFVGGGVCDCDEAGCFANPEITRTFDFTLAESEGASVLTGPDGECGDCTIRLVLEE